MVNDKRSNNNRNVQLQYVLGDECSSHKDCDSCVAAPKCAFCNDEKVCRAVLSKGPFDVGKVCSSLFQASWATCAG